MGGVIGCRSNERGLANTAEVLRTLPPIGGAALHEYGLGHSVTVAGIPQEFIKVVAHRGLRPKMMMRVDNLAIWIDNRFLNLL
jgi:hypothetical protein